jgi:large subunit ribosomal protein L18
MTGVGLEMKKAHEARQARLRRKDRVRRKVRGTGDRPRLSVYRSLSHIYAQLIDDDTGRTLASASSLRLELPEAGAAPEAGAEDEGKKKKKKEKKPEGLKVRRSRAVGKEIADKAAGLGIKSVVFDRNGFLYHGRVAALAEEARKNGLEF